MSKRSRHFGNPLFDSRRSAHQDFPGYGGESPTMTSPLKTTAMLEEDWENEGAGDPPELATYGERIEDLIQERDKVYKFADVCQLLGLPRDSTEEALKKWYVDSADDENRRNKMRESFGSHLITLPMFICGEVCKTEEDVLLFKAEFVTLAKDKKTRYLGQSASLEMHRDRAVRSVLHHAACNKHHHVQVLLFNTIVGAYLTRAAEVHQMYHSPVEFEKFFEFARRGRVHTEQKHLVSDIATARHERKILASLIVFEDNNGRNALDYAVVQCNVDLVKRMLAILALVLQPGELKRTILHVDSYGKNMFEIACDIAVFTTSDKRARRAVDIVAIFSCILKKEGGDIIKIPWKRCNMAQKRLWLGVARQALADWHADEKNFLGGFSVKRLLTTGTTDEMTYILAQALKPWSDKKEDQSVAKAAFKSTYAMPEFRAVLQPKVADFDAERQKWRVEVERDLHTIKETVLPEHPGIAHFVDKDSGYITSANAGILKKLIMHPENASEIIERDFSAALRAFNETGSFGINKVNVAFISYLLQKGNEELAVRTLFEGPQRAIPNDTVAVTDIADEDVDEILADEVVAEDDVDTSEPLSRRALHLRHSRVVPRWSSAFLARLKKGLFIVTDLATIKQVLRDHRRMYHARNELATSFRLDGTSALEQFLKERDHDGYEATQTALHLFDFRALCGAYGDSTTIFAAIARNPKSEVVNNTAMRAVAAYKWNMHHKHWFWGATVFFLGQLALVLALSVDTHWDTLAIDHEVARRTAEMDSVVLVFAVMTGVDTVNELFQLTSMPFYDGFNLFCYFNDFWNLLDIARIATSTAYAVLYFTEEHGSRQTLAFTASLFWISTMFYMLPYWDTGPLVVMIIQILKEISWFLIILLIGIIGMTNAFAVLGSSEGFEHNGVDGTLQGFFTVFNTLLFNTHDHSSIFDGMNAASSASGKVILVATLILITVILMNLLISILSDAYERIKDNTIEELTHIRIKIILRQELSLCGRIKYWYDKMCGNAFPEWLAVIMPEDVDVESRPEIWLGMLNAIKKNTRLEVAKVREEQELARKRTDEQFKLMKSVEELVKDVRDTVLLHNR